MAGVPFWDSDDPEEGAAWDRCSLGGTQLPGSATVQCPTRRDIDAKKSPGSDGATFADKGRELAQITIELFIHTREEWELWQAVRPTIEPRRLGGDKAPVAIDHPKAALAGVSAVYVSGIEEGDPSAAKGMTISIQCIEWAPAPKATKATTTRAVKAPSNALKDAVVGGWRRLRDVMQEPAPAPSTPGNSFYDFPSQ